MCIPLLVLIIIFNFSHVNEFQQSRWALICVLCRERVGACIQCSVKSCKTAYHVTCAFKHGLEMRPLVEDDENRTDEDNTVKLRVRYLFFFFFCIFYYVNFILFSPDTYVIDRWKEIIRYQLFSIVLDRKKVIKCKM